MQYELLKDINLKDYINDRVFVKFLAQDVEVRVQKDGVNKYLNLNMADRGTVVNAKRFGATDSEIEEMKSGKVYRAAVDIKEYKKDPSGISCILYNFEAIEEPASAYVEWEVGLNEACERIKYHLNKLNSNKEENNVYGLIAFSLLYSLWDKVTSWSAASSMHHSNLGGLAVHIAEVADQSEILADYWNRRYGYKLIDKELLISAALIHDIGKVYELDVDINTGNIQYSNFAALQTHIVKGIIMINNIAEELNIGTNNDGSKSEEQIISEREKVDLLIHCIASHHGKLEYGSPIVPHITEAYILNQADNMSAEMYDYNKELGKLNSGEVSRRWVQGLQKIVYKAKDKI